jgi:acetaldehyde dehydrogenase
MDLLKAAVDSMVARIQTYVPGYQLLLGPIIEHDRIVVMVKTLGLGDYLPKYAGNLDIINCAAIAMAEAFAMNRMRIAAAQEASGV